MPPRSKQPHSIMSEDMDPDFQALSQRQRKLIDRAFDRGLASSRSRGESSRKRRKVNDGRSVAMTQAVEVAKDGEEGEGGFVVDDEGGGFLPDEGDGGFIPEGDGGFIPDDDEDEGGFVLDDEGDGDGGSLPEDEGGFLPGNASPVVPTHPTSLSLEKPKIPIHLLPKLLTSLGLPSDQDVLAVFQASATGWSSNSGPASGKSRRRGGREEEEEHLGVELKDFRAVCAALMGPDDGMEGIESGGEEEGGGDDGDMVEGGKGVDGGEEGSDSEDSDIFQPSDIDSPLSSLSGSSYGAASPPPTRSSKSLRSGIKSKDFALTDSPGKSDKVSKRKTRGLELSGGVAKMSRRQKEVVKDIWGMVWDCLGEGKGKGKGRVMLGREEVRMLVRDLGEMWSEEEITDMVTLFSTQHEGRGLSYDDFGSIMLRAGLI